MQTLVVVDVQVGLIQGLPVYKGGEVVQTICGLIEQARRTRVPVIFVQHDGRNGHRLEPGTPGWPLDPALHPREGEIVLHKRSCDAFHHTELQTELARTDSNRLIIVGCMTQYCIDTTCRRAVSEGYDVTLVADAHTTADTRLLPAAQIIVHHNALLDGFNAGNRAITVVPSVNIDWST